MQLIPRIVVAGAVATVAALALAGQPATADSGAAFTDLDKLRIENRDLKVSLAEATATADQCATELGKVRAIVNRLAVEREDAQLKADLEAAHPGFTWNAKTRTLEPTKGGP